ncbi:MAG: hypothetical protein K8R36_19380 [Planctomycetales bacterium]|nr:hypothetical protein [Planctomycetales bacterium]
MTSPPKRRWYQVSLLALLILLGVGPILVTFLYFAIVDFQNAARKPRPDQDYQTLEEIFEKVKQDP